MRKEIEGLKTFITQTFTTGQVPQAQFEKLKNDLEQTQKSLEEADSKYTDRLCDAQRQLQEMDDAKETLQNELQESRRENDRLRRANREAENNDSEIQNLKDRLRQIASENERHKTQQRVHEQEMSQMKRGLEELHEKALNKIKLDLQQAHERINRLDFELEQVRMESRKEENVVKKLRELETMMRQERNATKVPAPSEFLKMVKSSPIICQP